MERNIDQERAKDTAAFCVLSGQREIKRLNLVTFPKDRRQYRKKKNPQNS